MSGAEHILGLTLANVTHGKRRRNGRPHERESGHRQSRLSSASGVARIPSELDQAFMIVTEADLRLPETSLAGLKEMAERLPFESAILNVAALQAHLEAVLADKLGHWDIARRFYEGRNDLLLGIRRVLEQHPQRVVFSPQALLLLTRVLISDAHTAKQRPLTSQEMRLLQDAVLGAHSAMDPWRPTGPPTDLDLVAYELQAATFFYRPPMLEEMADHRELLRLATSDPRLLESADRVPVETWLVEAANGVSVADQWAVGFGLLALTHMPSPPIYPHVPRATLTTCSHSSVCRALPCELPMLAASRGELQTAFAELGGSEQTWSWETRPFKQRPFLRLANNDIILLAPPWLLSWMGEGFHYRALTQAQRHGPELSASYTRFAGHVLERFALDIAETATAGSDAVVHSEHPYGPGSSKRTTDVAVAIGPDLVLWEIPRPPRRSYCRDRRHDN